MLGNCAMRLMTFNLFSQHLVFSTVCKVLRRDADVLFPFRTSQSYHCIKGDDAICPVTPKHYYTVKPQHMCNNIN